MFDTAQPGTPSSALPIGSVAVTSLGVPSGASSPAVAPNAGGVPDADFARTGGTETWFPRVTTVGRATAPAEGPQPLSEMSDGMLLRRFVERREDAAFTQLVQRHERFVLNVCNRVVGDAHLARDAFQATFVILARKAGVLNGQGPLAGWLYKVAYRLALRFRAAADRQRRREQAAAARSVQEVGDFAAAIEKEELLLALSEEIQRLPDKYRLPLVMCYFEGRTHAETARTIGIPRGSIAKRIGEGLERLRDRLTHRGLLP